MGKQTTNILKSKAKKIFEAHASIFTDDYEQNKNQLKKSDFFDYSKTDRNMVAGYITRIVKENMKED